MEKEQAIKHLEVIKGDCALVGDIRALDMAISALSGGEYIKKSELLQHVTTEELSDYKDCDVIHAEEIDELTTYSFPDSAENKGEYKHGHWVRMSDLPEDKDDRYKCSRCGNVVHHSNGVSLYTFNSWCGRCGSLNNPLLAGLDPYEGESEET